MGEINFAVNLSYAGDYLQDNDKAAAEAFFLQFVLWGVLLPIVALFGFVGNVLTMVVLWRREMQSPTIYYLRGLVVTDTGILVAGVISLTPFSCANYLNTGTLMYFKGRVYPHLHTPMNFLVMALQTCNVWLTVSVSVERYIAICHPFKAARLCTRTKALIVIVVIAIVSVCYNIPRLFATQVKSSCSNDTMTSCVEVADTMFGNSFGYRVIYSNGLYAVLIYIIPLSGLFLLNIFIIRELMRMQKRRRGTNMQDDNEANLSLVLVLIVVVFLMCQTPGLVAQFDIFAINVFYKWLAFSNFLFVFNSAVNFLIYTAFGRRFRQVLLRVFRRLSKHARGLSLGRSQVTTGYELTAVNDYSVSRPGTGMGSCCGEKSNQPSSPFGEPVKAMLPPPSPPTLTNHTDNVTRASTTSDSNHNNHVEESNCINDSQQDVEDPPPTLLPPPYSDVVNHPTIYGNTPLLTHEHNSIKEVRASDSCIS